MEKEDEFKKEVIDLVYFGKYAQGGHSESRNVAT
jgi:hypothetical protein